MNKGIKTNSKSAFIKKAEGRKAKVTIIKVNIYFFNLKSFQEKMGKVTIKSLLKKNTFLNQKNNPVKSFIFNIKRK